LLLNPSGLALPALRPGWPVWDRESRGELPGLGRRPVPASQSPVLV